MNSCSTDECFSSSVPFALAWVGVYPELQRPSVTTVGLGSLSAVLKHGGKSNARFASLKINISELKRRYFPLYCKDTVRCLVALVSLKGTKAPRRFQCQLHIVSFVINPMNWIFTLTPPANQPPPHTVTISAKCLLSPVLLTDGNWREKGQKVWPAPIHPRKRSCPYPSPRKSPCVRGNWFRGESHLIAV